MPFPSTQIGSSRSLPKAKTELKIPVDKPPATFPKPQSSPITVQNPDLFSPENEERIKNILKFLEIEKNASKMNEPTPTD